MYNAVLCGIWSVSEVVEMSTGKVRRERGERMGGRDVRWKVGGVKLDVM